MNRFLLFLLTILLFHQGFGQNSIVNHLNSSQFNKLINQQNGTLIDVRTSSEFSNGHISKSGQLNFYALDFKQKLLLLPKDEPVYIYCNTGYRSKKAAEILVKNGYAQVYNLKQGIMEWELENLPVVIEPNAKPDIKDKMESDEFYALIQTDKLVFIDFYAPWCGPCRKMMPIVDSLKQAYQKEITFVKINIDASKKLSRELKLKSVPYLVLYRNDNILFSENGLISQDKLTKVFKKNINN
jgi:thioredoxin